MSLKQQSTFRCPECGSDCTAEVWGDINIETDPEARERLIKGDFFMFSCPECGHDARLIYNCLYLDKERGQMFCLINGDENDASTKAAEADAIRAAEEMPFWKDGEYILRIVHSANDLREKIMIFECGLDDRIVEICKGVALSQLPEGSYVTEIHFVVIAGQKILALLCGDGSEQYVPDFQSLYDEMYTAYAGILPDLNGTSFQCVDIGYVGALLRRHEEAEANKQEEKE